MAGPRDVPLVPTMPPSGVHQETIVLNDAEGWRLEQRTRTSKAGKTSVRYSLSMDAEPILTNLRGLDLGRGPAEAILALIQKQHRAISEVAKPATRAWREKMARAFNGGSGSGPLLRRGAAIKRSDAELAQARYSGGKTGPMPPGGRSAVRIGIDSGRLVAGYFVRQNPAEGTYTINVPANRLDPETFGGGLPALERWVERLVQLVPALTGKGVFEDKGFRDAVGRSHPVQVLKAGAGWTWSNVAQIGRGLRGVAQAAGLL